MPRTLSESTERLLADLERIHAPSSLPTEESTEELIGVSDITRGLGFLYEKVRNTLDYKEEALWAKNAVYRALRRRLDAILSGAEVGRGILEELIRGRYLENNSVPESRAKEVDAILAKYRLLFAHASQTHRWEDGVLEEWIQELAASEISERVCTPPEDQTYISYMYRSMARLVRVAPELEVADIDLQLYLASFRTLLQADRGMEEYVVWRLLEPRWAAAPPELVQEISARLPQIKSHIERILSHPVRRKLDEIFKRRSILINLLRDLIAAEPERARAILEDPDELEPALKAFYEKRYKENRQRLQRTAVRAVIFIFVTKMLLALVAEVPYEIIRAGAVNFVALGVNSIIPPLILVGVAIAIRMPGEESNFVKLVMNFNTLITEAQSPAPLDTVRPDRPKSLWTQLSIGILYVANFALTFALLSWFLRALNFSWLSSAFFIFFLSLVAFFAIRLRKTANELAAVEEKEHYVRAVVDFLAFPIVELGRLLSRGLASINVASFMFDFIIEAPFHALVAILEDWLTFMKERKKSI